MSTRKIWTELPDADLLEVEEHVGLKTHAQRLDTLDNLMVAYLEGQITPQNLSLCIKAIDAASRMEERVSKSEQEVAKIIAQLGENMKEDLREEIEAGIEEATESFKVT